MERAKTRLPFSFRRKLGFNLIVLFALFLVLEGAFRFVGASPGPRRLDREPIHHGHECCARLREEGRGWRGNLGTNGTPLDAHNAILPGQEKGRHASDLLSGRIGRHGLALTAWCRPIHGF